MEYQTSSNIKMFLLKLFCAILFVMQCTARSSNMMKDSECYTANGADYQGNQNTTYVPGKGAYEPTYPNIEVCLPWADQDLPFNVTDINATLPKNYCRNPNNKLFPYCYVMRDGAPTSAFCHIPTCNTPALIGCFKLFIEGGPPPKGQENVTTTGPPPDLILDGEDSKVGDEEMRIARCLNFCRSKDYEYAGVTGGDTCMCGTEKEDGPQMNDVINHLHPHDCLADPCKGDGMQACGGDNAIAIYDVEAGSCDPQPFHDRDQGVIYSPRWPGRYHHEASCQWTIYVPDKFRKDKETMENHQMRISFSYFNLETKNDTLKIYTYANRTDTNSIRVGSYSGDDNPPEMILKISEVFAVHIVFNTDKDEKHFGFILHFNITNLRGEMETTLPDVVVTETTTTTEQTPPTRATTSRRTTTNPKPVTTPTTKPRTTSTVASKSATKSTTTTTTPVTTTTANKNTTAAVSGVEKHSSDAGKIAGIVLGVLVLVVLIVLGVIIFIRHRRNQEEKEETTPKPPAMFNNPVTFNSDTTL